MGAFSSYKGRLRTVLEESELGKEQKFISEIPDCLDLLTNLLETYTSEGAKKVGSRDRLKINAALGYLLAPRDMKPEEEAAYSNKWKYYSDDAFLILHVVNELIDSLGEETIKNSWPNEEEKQKIIRKLEELYKISKESVETEVEGLTGEILRYAGLE